MHIFAPLIGGAIAYYSGFAFLYMVGAILIIIGTIPLFLSNDNYEKIEFNPYSIFKKIFSGKERGAMISFSGHAIESIIGRVIWPVFLITILATMEKTGLIVALSMNLQ